MNVVVWLLCGVVPAALCAWLLSRRHPSRYDEAETVAITTGVLLGGPLSAVLALLAGLVWVALPLLSPDAAHERRRRRRLRARRVDVAARYDCTAADPNRRR